MEIILKIIEIINYSGIVQGLFFAVVLFTGKSNNRKAGYILGILLALFSVNIIHTLFLANNFNSPLKFREPFLTLLCPFLYFYILSITQKLKISLSIAKHFVLFFAFFIFQILLKIELFQRFTFSHKEIFSLLMIIAMIFQFCVYLLLIAKKTNVFNRKMENEFSSTDELDISWVKYFLMIFIIIYTILFFAVFFLIHLNYFTGYNIIIAAVCSVSVNILGYKAIQQQTLFKYLDSPAIKVELNEGKIISTETAVIESDDGISKELLTKITNYMEEKKPYLDPEITLSQMADELDLGRNALSSAINSGYKMNFFNFINKYRVEEMLSFLNDPTMENRNILQLAFDAGFNSKATFNHIFKKYTGCTPKEYKLRRLNT